MVTNEELANKLTKALFKLRANVRNEGEFRGDEDDDRFGFGRFGGSDGIDRDTGDVPFGRTGLASGLRSRKKGPFGRNGLASDPESREKGPFGRNGLASDPESREKGPFGRNGLASDPESREMPPFGRPDIRKRPMTRERILVLLVQYPNGVHQKDIAEEAGIGPSSLSELINKLESDGYVERKTDPNDKRATLLFLTEKGKARAAEVEEEQNEVYQNLFKNLTDEEKQTLSDLLDKIID